MMLAGCTSNPPSVLDPAPDAAWLEAERQRLPRPPSAEVAPVMTAASVVPGAMAWLEQGPEEVALWLAPLGQPGAARKITSRPLTHGYFNVTLSPDGKACLLLRQDPKTVGQAEKAILERWNFANDTHGEISDTAAAHFDPTWTDREGGFVFAEAMPGYIRVLEQNADGDRLQALALEAPFPRLVISPLSPDGFVIYDRTRPRDTHCWIRKVSPQGTVWAEVFLADREVRLLGWWKKRLLAVVRDDRDSSRFLSLPETALSLASGRLSLDGEVLARTGVVDFAILKAGRAAFLQSGAWGHQLRLLDLESRTVKDLSLPTTPGQGGKFREAGPSLASFTYDGPFQPPSLAMLNLAAGTVRPVKVDPLVGLDAASVKVQVQSSQVLLTPATANADAPVLVETYGGFQQTLLPNFDWVRVEWLKRGGSVRIEQIAVPPRQQREAVNQLLQRVADLTAPIVLRGQSTGATLCLMAMLAQPERFAAVWADAPVTDLLNFHRLPPGELWKGEFGDPEDPAQQQRLLSLSPLANVTQAAYPTLLLSTASDDIAVDSRHVTRFLSRLRELNPDGESYLLWETTGIHGRLRPGAADLGVAVDLLWKAALKRKG